MPFSLPAGYPNIQELITLKGVDPEPESPLYQMVKWYGDGMPDGLDAIEFCLTGLRGRFSFDDLKEQVDPLLKKSGIIETIYTELYGLQFLNSKGLLTTIRFPHNAPGSAPFDAAISIDGIDIAVDIKPMCGSGVRWIDEILRPSVLAWSEINGLGKFEIEIKYDGPISRQAISREKVRILESAKIALASNTTMPLHFDFDVVNEIENFDYHEPTLTVTTRVTVELREYSGMTVSGGSSPTYSQARMLSKTIDRHVSEKGQRAVDNGSPLFIVAYVRPPGFGDSDIQVHSFGDAMEHLEAIKGGFPWSDLWIGTMIIDWAPDPGRGIVKLFLVENPKLPPTLRLDALC